MASLAQSQAESMSEARAFWNSLMEQHPNVRGVLSIIGSLLGFFINGHVVIFLGHWVVMVSGRIAEKAMLFAVIWLTIDYIAYDFLSQHIADTAATLSTFALLALTLLPEIILYSAVVTSLSYWFTFFRDRTRYWAFAWAVLYSLPTVTFCVMTVVMICSLAPSGGHFQQASDSTMVVRSLAGWSYSLITLIHMAVGDRFGATGDATPQPTPVAPAPLKYEEIAQQLIPLLTPHLSGLRATLLEEIRPLIAASRVAPEPVNYQHLADIIMPLIAPLVVPPSAPLQAHKSATTSATLETPIDDESATRSATLRAQQTHNFATANAILNDDTSAQYEPENDTEQQTNNVTLLRTNKPTSTRSEKALKAARIIKRNPQIAPTELAKKAQISLSYARQLLAKRFA